MKKRSSDSNSFLKGITDLYKEIKLRFYISKEIWLLIVVLLIGFSVLAIHIYDKKDLIIYELQNL